MNGSTSIFDFIDGALDHSQEQALFDELARHPELRAELRHYIAIGEAVRADREAYMPPSEVEHALMAGLGLAPIASAGGAGVAAGGATAGMLGLGFLKRFTPLAGAFVAGMLIATGGFFAAYLSGDAVTNASGIRDTIFIRETPRSASALDAAPQAAPSQEQTATIDEPARLALAAPRAAASTRLSSVPSPASRAIPSMTSKPTAPPISNDGAALAVATPIDHSANAASSPADESGMAMRTVATTVAVRESDRDALAAIAIDAAAGATDVRGLDQNAETFAALMSTRESGMAYGELRSNAWMQPFVENNARRTETSIDDELVAGMFVRLGESFSTGLELGQGRYPQVLVYPETYTSDGRPVGREIERIEQEPSVAWVGIAGRWELGALARKLPVWTQLTLGYGFDQGPLLNGRAGVDFKLSRDLSLTGAVETTSLVYFFNGQPLVSGKYGLSFGVQLGM